MAEPPPRKPRPARPAAATLLRAAGRTLAEFLPLAPAETELLHATREGRQAQIADVCPTEETDANRVHAGFVRFLALGGDADAPVHEHGVQLSGAWIAGSLDFVAARAVCPLELHKCRIAQIDAIAARLAPLGVTFLRGGAFKPRSSPYNFQGHGDPALSWMRDAATKYGLRVVTEVLSEHDVTAVAELADLIQIGSRNMQNFALLKRVGHVGKPVLLKRAMSATIDEWLLAAEYLLHHGSSGVVLCERGIRGFDPSTRNLVDLTAVALLANVHRLPVIVDPSHGTGRRDLILPLARAALAAGAAGVMIETHDDPGRALSDGPQALRAEELQYVLQKLQAVTR